MSIKAAAAFYRIATRLRIARAIGEKNSVGLQGQCVRRRSFGRHHCHLATTLCEHAQDVVFDTEVKSHHMELGIACFAESRAQGPFGLGPVIRLLHRDFLRQIQARHAGGFERQGFGLGDQIVGDSLTWSQAQNCTVLGALAAQQAGQLAGVDVGNSYRFIADQVAREIRLRAKVAGDQRQVMDDQSRSMDLGRFRIFCVGAVIADVWIGKRDDLLAIAGIRQDFLVARDGGIENHLARCGAHCAD